jgi:hypothetical protein
VSKTKPSKKPAEAWDKMSLAGFWVVLFFDPGDGGDMLLRNIGNHCRENFNILLLLILIYRTAAPRREYLTARVYHTSSPYKSFLLPNGSLTV